MNSSQEALDWACPPHHRGCLIITSLFNGSFQETHPTFSHTFKTLIVKLWIPCKKKQNLIINLNALKPTSLGIKMFETFTQAYYFLSWVVGGKFLFRRRLRGNRVDIGNRNKMTPASSLTTIDTNCLTCLWILSTSLSLVRKLKLEGKLEWPVHTCIS